MLQQAPVLLLLLALTLPAELNAQLTYSTNNGAIIITGYTGPGGAVTIPSEINNLPVTSIGDSAFHGTGLTSVTIPNSVTGIGVGAFAGTPLTSVTIPNGVTGIGNDAFFVCSSLTNVTIPDSVTSIGEMAFAGCISLTGITVNAGNPAYASVAGVLFNGSQTSLLQYPPNTVGPTYVIPGGVTNIGEWAFYYSSALTSVVIPDSVTGIGDEAFGDCSSLTAITVDPLNSTYSSLGGVLFDKSQRTLIQFPASKAGSYTIPAGVTSIGERAFANCTSLMSIALPGTITNLGRYAFYYCSALTSVVIPDSVTSIGEGVFVFCVSLTNIALPSSVTSIGLTAFEFCFNLSNITIPDRVASIGDGAFISCTSLTNITLPNSVTSVGEEAFSSCTNLIEVTFGNGVTNLGFSQFWFCPRLTTLFFEGNAPTGAFSLFAGSARPTIYYLPGTSGWGSTFGGAPTVLWNPQIQIGGTSFGVRTNQFGFILTGTSNLVVVVEASTNLANAAWSPLATNTLAGGLSYFSDPQWAKYPSRFYRLRWP